MISREIKNKISCTQSRLDIILSLFIAFQVMIWFDKYESISVLNDEFGYWGNAAILSGYGWNDLFSRTPYYSLGYSLLLLPIIAVTKNTQIWYQYAIILNVLMLVSSYFLCRKTLRLIFKKEDSCLLSVIAFITISFSSNIIYAEVAWSETVLLLLIWLITWIIAKNSLEYNIYINVCAFLLLFYFLLIHPRSIPIYIYGTILLIVQGVISLEKNKWKLVFLFLYLLISIIGFLFYDGIKQWQLTTLWNNSSASVLNSANVADTSLSYFYNILKNPDLFVTSLIGKIDCALFSTAFLLFIPLINTVYCCWNKYRTKEKDLAELIPYLWAVGITFGMILLSALQMLDWQHRKDMVVYSRYFDFALSPLLAIAIVQFRQRNILNKWTVIVSSGLFFLSIRYVYQRIKFANGSFNSICSPMIGAYIDNIPNIKIAFFIIVIIMISLFSLEIFYNLNIKRIGYYTVLLGLSIFYISTSYLGAEYVNYARDLFHNKVNPIYQKIINQKDILFIENSELDQYSVNPKYLQYWIPDRSISVVTIDEFEKLSKEKIEDKYYVLINSRDLYAHKALIRQGYHDLRAYDSFLRIYE